MNRERAVYRRAQSQVVAAKLAAGKRAPWGYYMAIAENPVEARALQALDEAENS